jgi:hypothetical protein
MKTAKYIISARNKSNGHTEFDSDYVGNDQSHLQTLDDVRTQLAELRSDPEWDGWEFHVDQRNESGHFLPISHAEWISLQVTS